MRSRVVRAVVAALAAACGGVAAAQPAVSFTYQGRLTANQAGYNGTADIRFKLFDAAEGGQQIGPELMLNGAQVINGLFAADLNFGPAAINGANRWIEISVRTPGWAGIGEPPPPFVMLTPRQQVKAAPMAGYASAGAWPGTVSGNNTLFPTGNVGIGVSNPGQKLDVSGNAKVSGWIGTDSNSSSATLRAGDAQMNLRYVQSTYLSLTHRGASVVNGFGNNLITPGVVGATISGGGQRTSDGANVIEYPNVVTDDNGTIGGGYGNRAGDGLPPLWNAGSATVGGGVNNVASGYASTITGGHDNRASGSYASIIGGSQNFATADASVAFGRRNRAQGVGAIAAGGEDNFAGADHSFAAGRRARIDVKDEGTFLWSDSLGIDFLSLAPNEFAARATGGVRFVTNASANTGVRLAPGGGAWLTLSDKASKTEFAEVDAQRVLEKVAELPITSWAYIGQPGGVRHIGPTAQDFYAAFGVGEGETTICTVDADGVALAAIKGLARRDKDREARIADLERENAELKARLERLEKALAKD